MSGLVEVLAAHEAWEDYSDDFIVRCECGESCEDHDAHRTHVAAKVAEWLAEVPGTADGGER